LTFVFSPLLSSVGGGHWKSSGSHPGHGVSWSGVEGRVPPRPSALPALTHARPCC
jgi:hypothetical protein